MQVQCLSSAPPPGQWLNTIGDEGRGHVNPSISEPHVLVERAGQDPRLHEPLLPFCALPPTPDLHHCHGPRQGLSILSIRLYLRGTSKTRPHLQYIQPPTPCPTPSLSSLEFLLSQALGLASSRAKSRSSACSPSKCHWVLVAYLPECHWTWLTACHHLWHEPSQWPP